MVKWSWIGRKRIIRWYLMGLSLQKLHPFYCRFAQNFVILFPNMHEQPLRRNKAKTWTTVGTLLHGLTSWWTLLSLFIGWLFKYLVGRFPVWHRSCKCIAPIGALVNYNQWKFIIHEVYLENIPARTMDWKSSGLFNVIQDSKYIRYCFVIVSGF